MPTIRRLLAVLVLALAGVCGVRLMPPPPSYIDITSLPFTTAVPQADFNAGTYGGTANQCWFRRVVSAGEEFLGAFIDQGGNFTPNVRLYQSDGTTLIRTISGTKAWWFRFTTGTYYFNVRNNSGFGSSNFDWTFEAEEPPAVSITPGDFVINDDTTIPGSSTVSWAATVWDINGNLKGITHGIPASEIGDALPSGVSLWHDRFGTQGSAGTLALFDANLGLIAGGLSVGAMAGTFPSICNDGTQFYVLNKSTRGIYTVSASGTVTGPIDTLPAGTYTAIGVKRDGSILYHAHGSSDGAIGQWDLVGHSALGTLYTVPGFAAGDYVGLTALNNHPGDLIVLSDDSIVFAFHDNSANTDHLIQIDASGALMEDHSFAAPNSIDHIHYSDAGNPSHVRVWFYTDSNLGNEGRLADVELSTGMVTPFFDTDLYSAGINLVTNSNQKFRPSASCVVVTLGYDSSTPPPTGDPPPTDIGEPCPCPGGGGPADVPDPLLPFAPTYVCPGGGTIEELADLPGLAACWLDPAELLAS